jgi:hypothetical protein
MIVGDGRELSSAQREYRFSGAHFDTATELPSPPSPREERAGREPGRGAALNHIEDDTTTPLPNPLPIRSSWGEGTRRHSRVVAVSRCTRFSGQSKRKCISFWLPRSPREEWAGLTGVWKQGTRLPGPALALLASAQDVILWAFSPKTTANGCRWAKDSLLAPNVRVAPMGRRKGIVETVFPAYHPRVNCENSEQS